MANKLKNSAGKKVKADPKKADSKAFKKEKEESIDWKKLARDERTWKIAGALFLLIAVFLLVAFISYFFTWKEDQAKVFRGGSSLLVDNDIKVSNLLGRLGALVSHFFIYKGFGIASLLIVTFFFVVGTNLLFNRKVFSIWRNLKYVTIGLLVLSTSLAFVLSASDFPFGGGTGMMISRWLTGIFGTIGTAALLMVVAFAYFIWQFNPAFRVPGQTKELMPAKEGAAQDQTEEAPTAAAGKTINEMYAAGEGNSLKGNTRMIDLAVNDAADLLDVLFEDAVGRWIGHHQRRECLRVLLCLGAKIVEDDVAVAVAGDDNDLQSGHRRARRIGAVGGRRNEDDIAFRLAPIAMIRTNRHQPGELTLGSGIRLERHRVETRDGAERVFELSENLPISFRLI